MGIYATALTSGNFTSQARGRAGERCRARPPPTPADPRARPLHPPPQVKLGGGITLAGLALQLLFFAVFVALCVYVHRHPE